jgi:hypothetical protein
MRPHRHWMDGSMSDSVAGFRPVIREVVGVFPDEARFQAAIDDLLSSGFDRAELSLLAGAVGVALARLIDQHHADHLQHQIDAGGLLLCVHVRDAEHGARAPDILARHGATDIHQHDLVPRRYLAARPDASDLERALLDPTAVFRTPEEVLARQDLTRDQKAAIRQRWRYDAIELEVAETEGMRDGEPDLLDRVLDALRRARHVSPPLSRCPRSSRRSRRSTCRAPWPSRCRTRRGPRCAGRRRRGAEP